jgi:tRNA (guanine37-N1)-methyltransferase
MAGLEIKSAEDMTIHVLTIFPEFFTSPLACSILKRAQENEAVKYHIVNIRDFTHDPHHSTDDRPYGGGPGMVMKVEPLVEALESLQLPKGSATRTILTSAKGKLFTQQTAREYSNLSDLVVVCGHYEGVDERFTEHFIDEEVRIGDYVLTGGEPAALVMADAVTRLLPEVLGNEQSNVNESHAEPGVLGFPQYTRPEVFRDWSVPEILLQGNHAEIMKWREAQKRHA